MNAMTVSFVLVRLAAAFLFVRGVEGLASYSFMLAGDSQVSAFALITLVFGVFMPIGIAVILWLHPEKVTGAQIINTKPEEAVSASAILMIGITLLGLYVFVYGVVDLFRVEAMQIMQSEMAADLNLPNEAMSAQVIANRVTYAVKVILGLCLIFGRSGLTRMLLKAKYGGLAVSKPEE